MRTSLLIFATVGLLAACAHHPDVRPGAKGVHRVVVQAEDPDDGTKEAIRQANSYCGKKDKEAAFIDEDKKYTGDMDEKTYKNAKRASTAAKAVGSAAWVFGGKRESNAGGVAALGGSAADAALGEGYTVEMKFKCQ